MPRTALKTNCLAFCYLALLLLSQTAASACSACYGQNTDSPLADGMNWGIMSLLAFIITVLIGVASFFVFLARKAGSLQPDPQPTTASLNS